MKTEWGCKFMTWFRMNFRGEFRPGTPDPTNWRAFVITNFVNGAK